MIISRWHGFEIDSSEGFFFFRKEAEHTEEGWDVLLRLLRSPLILGKVAFALEARSGKETSLRKRLSDLLAEGRLEEAVPDEEFVTLDFKAPISLLLEIVEPMRDSLRRVEINVCFKPFRNLPPEDLRRLRSWFMTPGNAYDDVEAARRRWNALAKVGEADLGLIGFTGNRHIEGISLAFEAQFQVDLEKPFRIEVATSGGDPSLVDYLFRKIIPGFDVQYIYD